MEEPDPPNPSTSKNATPSRLPTATLKQPTIEAILGGHFRFATKEQAIERLKAVRESFHVSKVPQDEKPNPLELKLWIRGYGLTSEAREEGYLGHFALLRVARAPEEKWTIEASLLNVDKKFHPQRRQTTQKFPNWGHPILRDVKRGRVHSTVESAQGELQRLHEAYSETTIPLTNKLYFMVYGKPKPGKPPVEKWVLEIKAREEGDFIITHVPNMHRAEAKNSPKITPESNSSEPQGKFTAQVLLKRKPAKRRNTPKPPPSETK
jgi:hypothetical protein